MQLWGDDVEAMRRPAVAAVAAAITGAVASTPGGWGEPRDHEERLQFVAALRARMAASIGPPTGDSRAGDCTVAGVPCRVTPARGSAPVAIYLHFHGGGMVRGEPRLNDTTNGELSDRFAMTVVSVDYRLAPEHPHPAGPDDGETVARWLIDRAGERFGADRLVIGGESSGAHVAAMVLLRLRDAGLADHVAGANLMYGMFDWGRSASQRGVRASRAPDLLDPDRLRFFGDCYLPDRTEDQRRAPEVSVAFADLHGLPPGFFSVGTADHLLDDTLVTAIRWAAAGNDTELFVAPDMPHGFNVIPCDLTAVWERRRDEWIRRVLDLPHMED